MGGGIWAVTYSTRFSKSIPPSGFGWGMQHTRTGNGSRTKLGITWTIRGVVLRLPRMIQVRSSAWLCSLDYRALWGTSAKVLGVWDDHDYGIGNGDWSFVGKEVFKQLYLDFIDEPAESERRIEGWGLYQDYIITTTEGVRIQLILLDVRFAYDPITDDRLGP